MKKILVFVSTLDGKVTKWGDPYVKSWSSRSDQEYFRKVWDESRLIIMGRNTFLADPIKPSEKRILVIMTSHPSDYSKYSVPGQIEFTKESPHDLTSRFSMEGYDEMLIVGGPTISTAFLKDQLVDELWLTIEPKIFGQGNWLVTGEKLDINLRLISLEKANDSGTLITKYAVLR